MSNEHLEADYSQLLKEYKEPMQQGVKVPYTLWGRIAKVKGEPQPDLAELRLVGSHAQSDRAMQYAGWGWKLVKFYIPEPVQGKPDEFGQLRNTLRTISVPSDYADLKRQLEEEQKKNQVLESKVKSK